MNQPTDPNRTIDETPRQNPLADSFGPQETAAPARLELLEEIARGGMGAILRGRDADIGRDVAVKVLLEDHRDRPELARRFLEEARIAGRLQHPGVAPVYSLGRMPDGRPYFAMKLIKGRTLTALLAERADLAADRMRFLAVFEQVCQTLAYAHARGVIHRDLKPSNVMVGAYGEVQVMDWGLAKVLIPGGAGAAAQTNGRATEAVSVIQTPRGEEADSGQDGSETRAGSVLGTPGYMVPEQARGELEDVEQRADVFGLGAILCEVLTGRPPFVGPSEAALKRARRGDLADALTRLDGSGADAELIALAKRCLSANPAGRPTDAGEVSAAVTAYRESVERRLRAAEVARAAEEARAEEARATADQERKAREAAQARAAAERRARRLTVALAAAVLLLVVLGGGGWMWLQVQRAERLAENNWAVKEALSQAKGLREQAGAAENSPALSLLEQAREQALRAKALVESGPADTALAAQARELLAGLDAEADNRRQSLDHARHGSILYSGGMVNEAHAEWIKAIELDPNLAVAHVGLGMVQARSRPGG
jgi:tetratricopeptide (TPR) repeat protein